MNPPGELISIGTHRLHLNREGSGRPVVVFDAALGASSLSWTLVQPEVARLTRTCAYDRAGFGWSEAGPLPRTAGRIADELHALLHAAGEPPPYVLVGHSYGGLVTRIFAGRYHDEAAALVLLEPAHPEDWLEPVEEDRAKIERGVKLCRRGAIAARLGLARVVAALVGVGALLPARALVRLISRGGLRREDEVILAPVWKLPPEVRRPLRRFWTTPRFFDALGSQIASIGTSAREVLDAAPHGYGDLPLVTVSSSRPDPVRLRRQEALAALSSRGRHVVTSSSGHWIPLDAPRLVVDVIAEVVRAVRATAACS